MPRSSIYKALAAFLMLMVCLQGRAQNCSNLDFTSNLRKGCALLVVQFSASGASSANGDKFDWNLGAGFVKGRDTISKAYSVAGKYTITMHVTFANGDTCTVKKDTFITVNATPVPVMSINPGGIVCDRSKPVIFTDSTKNTIDRQWIIEGVTLRTTPAVYNFTSQGTKQITLAAINQAGCTGYQKKNIIVNNAVKVDFCASMTVYDTVIRANFVPYLGPIDPGRTIAKYEWNVAGLPIVTGKTALFYIPSIHKKRDVTLTIYMTDGCIYSYTKKGFISDFITPAFRDECAGSLFGVYTDLSDTGRHHYKYNFPDYNEILFPNGPDPKEFSIRYDTAGPYPATLTYYYLSAPGCPVQVYYPQYINITGPKAKFTSYDNLTCHFGDTIHFVNLTNAYGAPDLKYTWYIFDSLDNLLKKRFKLGPTFSQDTFYVPGKLGQYGVGLVAVSSNGCKDSINYPGFISENDPKSDFTSASRVGCLGDGLLIKAAPKPAEAKYYSYKYTWHYVSDRLPVDTSKTIGPVCFIDPYILGPYTVMLRVDNGHCHSDTMKKGYLNILGAHGHIIIGDTIGCLNPDFTTTLKWVGEDIFPNDPKNPPKYHWYTDNDRYVDFSDDSATSTKITFKKNGKYSIYMDIFTHLGKDTCKSTTYREGVLGVNIGVQVGFAQHEARCVGDTIAIDDYADPAASGFRWNIDPLGAALIVPSDTVRQISVIPLTDSCFTLTESASKIISGKWCTSSTSNDICLKPASVDFYTTTPQFYCAPQVARFVNTSKHGAAFMWYFDDGDSLYVTNANDVSHAYLKFNKPYFNVTLKVFDSNGCVRSITKKNIIKVVGPFPQFSMSQASVCDSVRVTFKNLSSQVKRFSFFYDDGTPVDTISLKPHTYYFQDPTLDSIYFYPTLLSRDDAGCKIFWKDTVKLYRSASDAFMTGGPVFGCVPLTVHYQASSAYASGWIWDMDGDGKTDGTASDITFKYTKPGKYRAKLLALNGIHCPYLVLSDTITVLPNVVPGFSPAVTAFCGKQQLLFKNTSQFYSAYKIDYGDGSPADSNTIALHTYYFDTSRVTADSMVFHPRLVAWNAAGCSDTFTGTVVARRMPVAGFNSSVITGCAPLGVTFTDTSKHGFAAKWDFENDSRTDAYGRIATHTFGPGIYTVKMLSISAAGCVDSVVKVNLMNVNDPPRADFKAKDSDVCFGAAVPFTNLTFPYQHVVNWRWKVSDSVQFNPSDSAMSPVITFYKAGLSTVSLSATDDKGCTGQVTKTAVYVEDTLPPKNSALLYVTVLDTHKVLLVWNSNALRLFKNYIINRVKGGQASVITQLPAETDTMYIDTAADVNTGDTSYCYSVQTGNTCGKVSFASFTHCTVLLKGTAGAGPQNMLTWSPYTGWGVAYYRIYRADSSGHYVLIDSVPGNMLHYEDSMLCDESYTYYTEAVKTGVPVYTSMSNKVRLKALYQRQARPVDLRYVTDLENGTVKLAWDTVAYKNLAGYTIDRYTDLAGWQPGYAATTDNSYTDGKVDVNSYSYRYHVKTLDKCGYTGPNSNPGTSILLKANVLSDRVNLRWNGYHQWPAGVKNYALQIRLGFNSYKTIRLLSDTQYVDDSVYQVLDTAYCYRVIAHASNDIDSSVSNLSCAVLPSRIFVPNAFSPNGDGHNDVWKVSAISIYNAVGKDIKSFHIKVYNRWGTLVFSTNDLNQGWDGTFHGQPSPLDVYIYLLDAESVDSRVLHLKGNVTLLR